MGADSKKSVGSSWQNGKIINYAHIAVWNQMSLKDKALRELKTIQYK